MALSLVFRSFILQLLYISSFSDEQAGRLMYYYGRLSPEMKRLLIAEAQLLLKHDPQNRDAEK